jgi:outer membrane protein assembly factor BamB
VKTLAIMTTLALCAGSLLAPGIEADASAAGLAAPDNWPQWRGPNLDGTTDETGLPTTWGIDSNIAWELEIADSWTGATPIIWEDTIFLNVSYVQRAAERGGFGGGGRGRGRGRGGAPPADQPAAPEEPEVLNVELWRVDRATGQIVWKRFLSDNDHQERKQNMSSPSPVTDGEHVWVMTGTGWLRSFDFDGNEVWSRNISDDYWKFGLNWGFASSPLLHEDALYVQVLHGMRTDDPSYVLRIDKHTGETVWMVQRPTDAIVESPDSYTTPALLQYDGTTEIVITGGDVVTGHDPQTGEELWRVDGLNPSNNRNYRIVASPVVIGDVVVAPTRVRPMLVLAAGANAGTPSLLWSFDSGPDVPTPVSDGELLYVIEDNGVMHALDLRTGEPAYTRQRIEPGTYSASPILADGKIYATSEDGVTTVIKAGPEFEVLATNSLDGYTLSTPAMAYGHIYMRVGDKLYAIGS